MSASDSRADGRATVLCGVTGATLVYYELWVREGAGIPEPIEQLRETARATGLTLGLPGTVIGG